jgi:hypothetical protein
MIFEINFIAVYEKALAPFAAQGSFGKLDPLLLVCFAEPLEKDSSQTTVQRCAQGCWSEIRIVPAYIEPCPVARSCSKVH